MRRYAMVFAVLITGVGLLIAAGDAKEETIMKEMAALKGTWAVVWAERDGKRLSEEQIKGVRFTIEEKIRPPEDLTEMISESERRRCQHK